jgi:hypothetical protein
MNRLLIGFFLLQVIVDLAHSVTAFPFVHYGMFSESFTRPDTLTVYEITADGHLLQTADFSIYQWDLVQNALISHEKQVKTGDFAFDKEKISAGMRKVGMGGLYRLAAPNLDNAAGTADRFPDWYRTWLSGLTGHPIHTLRVDKASYRYSAGHLILLGKVNRININTPASE